MQTARRSSRLNRVAVAIACIGILAIVVHDEYSNWKRRVAEIESSLRETTTSIVRRVDDTVQLAEVALDALLAEVEAEERAGRVPERLVDLMRRQTGLSGRFGAFSLFGADGRVRMSSHEGMNTSVDVSDRVYFQYHRDHPQGGTYIGAPLRSRFGDGWVITVSRRHEHADGSFGGVMAAAIPMRSIIDFLDEFDVGEKGSFLVLRGDGVLLLRMPFVDELVGMDASYFRLFGQLTASGQGVYEYQSEIDGEPRLGAFERSALTGLVVQTAVSRPELLADWRRAAQIRWMSFACLLALGLFAAWRWMHQSRLRRRREAELASREAAFRVLAESSGDMIQRLDAQGVWEYVSPAAHSLLGLPPEELIGRNILDGLDAEQATRVGAVLDRLLAGSPSESVDFSTRHRDGRTVWLEATLSRIPISDDSEHGGGIVAITHDVTHHKLEQASLGELASTDPLTGLANRRVFDWRLRGMVGKAGEQHREASLVIMDIDRFKLFNDSQGHAAGDVCLRAVAQAAKSCVSRADDCIARIGGEEFAVLLPDTRGESARLLAERIREAVAALRIAHPPNLPWAHVTISLGVATLRAESHGADPVASLFERADAALYRAKDAGRNQVAVDGVPSA